MSKNKIKTIILSIILILIIAGIGYYFYAQQKGGPNNSGQPDQPQTPEEKLFEFKNLDDQLSQEIFDKYQQEFEVNKDFIINNPQALNPSYWLKIARLKKYIKDYNGARDIYLFLIGKDPSNHTAEANLADLYANYINDYNQAAEHYWKAVDKAVVKNVKFLYYRNLADIYAFKLKNQRQDFEDEMTKLYNDDYFKDNADFFGMMAKYYENINDNKQAIEHLEKSLKLSPDNQSIQEKIDYLKSK